MLRVSLVTLGSLLLTLTVLAAQPGYQARLIGGTLPGLQAKSGARLDISGSDSLRLFNRNAEVRIDYNKIRTIEYGQSVSRRYAAAILISPVLLLSKSRKHFVTLEYDDAEGRQQALVFRVNKGDIRSLLASLEARTGRRVEYQDDEARKGNR
jgi:hypothetical protein